ncbi:hypothetical protein PC116_g19118 [Phytophthora cactorum]|nr:hypothetical protein PC116_g19118 [Phytophthora cactorum]
MTGPVGLVRTADSDSATVAYAAERVIESKATLVDAAMCTAPGTGDTKDSSAVK